MKRTKEDDGPENMDAFYEEISKERNAHRAMVASYVNDQCPPAPFEGIEEVFADMEKACRASLARGAPFFHFQCWEKSGVPWDAPFPCKWWAEMVSWHKEMVTRRKYFIRDHGSNEEFQEYCRGAWDRIAKVKQAMCDGWNKLHPNLPAVFIDGGMTLAITYMDPIP